LVKQVSSEEKEDPNKIGQYGTGFMTTHSFSRIIKIDGSFLLDPTNRKDLFVDLNDFLIDRTYESITEFVEKLCDQLDQIDKLMDASVTTERREWTKLKYSMDDECKKNASDGIKNAIQVIPYVMTLNTTIEEYKIDDNLNNIHLVFRKTEMPEDEGLRVMQINIENENEVVSANSRTKYCYYLQTEDERCKVILPLETATRAKNIDDIAKLFLFFPLIGSEKFGMNFIFHSADFRPLEARNGLYLPESNINNKIDFTHNVEELNKITDMLFDYLREHISHIENSIELASISFDCINGEDDRVKFFKIFKDKWVKVFESLYMIPTKDSIKSIKSSDGFRVFDKEITNFLSADESRTYLDTVYSYASNMCLLPIKNESIQWSKIVYDWVGKSDDYYVGIEEIVSSIKESTDGNLHSLLTFLNKCGKSELFKEHAIIPNRENTYKKSNELKDATDITNDLYSLAKPLISKETDKFVHPDYADIYPFVKYGRDDLRSHINDEISAQKKVSIQALPTPKILNTTFEDNLIKYCSAYPNAEGKSNRNQIMPVICKMLEKEYKKIIMSKLSSEEKELYDVAFDCIVENLLLQISMKDVEWVKTNYEELRSLVEKVSVIADYKKNLIEKYAIFPNQLMEIHLSKELFQNIDIPEDFDVIYKQAFNKELKKILVDDSFRGFIEFEEKTGKEIAKEVEEYLKENKFENQLTIDIIEKIDTGQWKGLFEYIEKNKEEIFFTRVQDSNKRSVYKLMKISDNNKLETLAQLSENPDMDLILEKAKNIIEQRRFEKCDFEKKREIGKRIEDMIREKIKEYLDVSTLGFKMKDSFDCDWTVNDIQNGQDIVVTYRGVYVYYIEVKSKWNFSEAAHMSKNQMKMAYKNSTKYALCCIDLSDCGVEDRLYPEMDVILNNLSVHLNIGNELDRIMKGIIDADEDNFENSIKMDGDYRASITKKVFNSGERIEQLIDKIVEDIHAA
jgi:hypothetical protein